MRMKNPCHHCQKRQMACHSTCPDYLAWRNEREKANEARRANNELQDAIYRAEQAARKRMNKKFKHK